MQGWWESPDAITSVTTGGTDTYGTTAANLNALFSCKATGDFRKAICETTSVIPDEEVCTVANQASGSGHVTAVQKCKFMLDQLDADTGEVDELMCDVQCCGSTGCSDYPWAVLTGAYNLIAVAEGYPPLLGPEAATAFGPQVNTKLSLLPGKSNNHVRAIQVTQAPMYSDFAQGVFPSELQPFAYTFQLRRVAGGFKEE